MSLWQRIRDSFRGPLHVEGMNDPEVEEDLDEEMPDAAEDAREMAEEPARIQAQMEPAGGLASSPLAPPPPTTIEFEGAEEAANEDAEAPDHTS